MQNKIDKKNLKKFFLGGVGGYFWKKKVNQGVVGSVNSKKKLTPVMYNFFLKLTPDHNIKLSDLIFKA